MLSIGGMAVQMKFLGNQPLNTLFGLLYLVGLALVVSSPLLMALKFFA